MLLLGWSRAILLQLAHPLVAAGVADHSQFRAGAVAAASRLRSTVRTMQSLVYGDEADWHRSIETIRAIHRRVHGELRVATAAYPAGTPYSAEDPALVLWVHATFIDSAIPLYERLVGPLDESERDRYCDEGAGTALALGARPEDVPRRWADLQEYMAQEYASGRIGVGPDARALADAVLFPPLSLITGPAAWLNRLVTIGLLPERLRAEYGYAWPASRDRQLRLALGSLRVARRVLPRPIAWWADARRPARRLSVSAP
jgi:uncharacterized protein (DUF2236 family)